MIHWNSIRSKVASQTIEYIPAPAPELKYANGVVTITDSNPSAVIHYTTDGSAPTTSSAVYYSPVSISPDSTVRAIAEVKGYGPSAVKLLTVTAGGSILRDVSVKDWHYANFSAAVDQGIINGTSRRSCLLTAI